MICRYGIFRKAIIDGGPKNSRLTELLISKYSIRKVKISIYYPKANSIVKRGYGLIIDTLVKILERRRR